MPPPASRPLGAQRSRPLPLPVLTRERLKELQRAGRRPNVKSIKEKDIVAALGQLRDLLQSDVGVAAQVLKALVGDVVLEKRQVEGQVKPQMVARFTINAVPALAVLDRGRPGETGGTSWPAACSEQPVGLAGKATPKEVIVPLKRKCHRAGGDHPVTPPTDSQPPQA
jgi:hypothetical protein